ncbi:hypothetical protein JVT61DRAFT_11311 [Boletus reticuloceps]|uniref:Uncharacterized protein n=1 Tax=Boletus reticuloceps TaxID=495285 RepID=A0A8I2YEU7_9AGAM|nr:hypothetical protein JVT61DRAFT_11311 [Boletus reticuloceps]
MSDLADGRYYILPATPSGPPALPIGGLTDKSPSPVVVGGGDRLWTVKRVEEDIYTLTLEQFGQRYTEISGRDIVVDLAPSPQKWAINERLGLCATPKLTLRCGRSTDEIKLVLISITPHGQVKISIFEFPEHIPRWTFNRLIEETN